MNESKATAPISGRVSEGDYSFLMEYPISGKVTASEKLRYVVSFFRSYHENLDRYDDMLMEIHRLMDPVRKQIKSAERDSELSSELVDRLMHVLPESLAYLITAKIPDSKDKQLPVLLELEERLFKTYLTLLESMLRMGLTSESPTYNRNLMQGRMKMIRELVDMRRDQTTS